MIDLEQEAEIVAKTTEKLEKALQKLEFTTSIAVVNFLFLKLTLKQAGNSTVAKAMAAVFLNNVVNSINSFYHSSDDEHVH